MSNDNITELFQKHHLDYLTIVGLVILSVIGVGVKPSAEYININDSRIQYPYKDPSLDKVPDAYCLLWGFILPLITIVALELWRINFNVWKLFSNKQAFQRVHNLVLSYFTATFTALFIVCWLKNWISRPRPDFLARCQVNYKLVKPTINVYKVSEICQGDVSVVDEGLRSTPSGHSSISFTGLNFLSLYLFSNFKTLNLLKLFAGYSPLIISTYIATSRLSDFKHSLFDISFGATLGVVISISVWKYFDRKVIDSNGNFTGLSSADDYDENQPILPL